MTRKRPGRPDTPADDRTLNDPDPQNIDFDTVAADFSAFLRDNREPCKLPVRVDGFAGEVYACELSVDRRGDFEAELVTRSADGVVFNAADDPGLFRAALVKHCAIDAAGNLLFGHLTLAEIRALPNRVAEPFVNVALALNRFTKTEFDALKKT